MAPGANIKSGSIAGHKEFSVEEQDRRRGGSMLDNRDPEALMQNRILNKENIGRAAMFDKNDAQQLAGSVQRFDVTTEKVRELLDALLAVQRQVEGSNTTVTGQAPSEVEVEGTKYTWADKSTGSAVLTASGKPDLFVVQTALYFVMFESTGDRAAIKTWADTFADSLQANAM